MLAVVRLSSLVVDLPSGGVTVVLVHWLKDPQVQPDVEKILVIAPIEPHVTFLCINLGLLIKEYVQSTRVNSAPYLIRTNGL